MWLPAFQKKSGGHLKKYSVTTQKTTAYYLLILEAASIASTSLVDLTWIP
jgi:hypothetical protein